MITQRMIGQFGNQAIQYVAARIIAEHTGQAYDPPADFVDKQGRPVQWTAEPFLRMEPSPGRRLDGPIQTIDCMHTFDPTTLDPDRPIHIQQGYFQSYDLLQPYGDKIRNDWLKIHHPPVEVDPDAVYVHCRLKDYVPGVDNPNRPADHGVSTTIEEYARCLKFIPEAKSLVICTDEPGHPSIQDFDKLDMPWTLSGKSWDEDFLLLASARWMLMSQSSYSWLAGFLGRCERIVCPITQGTHWHCGLTDDSKVRLYPHDQPERWIWAT